MKKIIQLFFALIIIVSCNQRKYDTLNSLPFDELIAESDQIIIKVYDSTVEKQITNIQYSKPKKTFKVAKEKKIDFKNIFKNAKKTGYCCCPLSNYSITLFDDDEFGLFFVDTTEFRNKVRIYDTGYQYSYILEKQKWKHFLNEIENKSTPK